MKYLSCFFILILGCSSLSGKGETISGPAKMFSKPGNNAIILLYDSVSVSCSELQDGWYKIRISINLTKATYENKSPFKMGEKIRDLKGNVIGMALTDIPYDNSETWASQDSYGMYMYGFIEKPYIRTNSIPEDPLIDIINSNKSNLTFRVFKDFISNFTFESSDLLKKDYPYLKEYTLADDWPSPIDPIDRIGLIFENDTLIGIIHSRPLSVDNIEDYNLDRWEKLLLFMTPANTAKKEFIQKYIDIYRIAN